MENMKKKELLIERRAQGLSFDKIAKELKVSKQCLIDWSHEFSEEIANLKAIELEALYEKYFLLKENRIQSFGELLGRLKEELATRDFSDIPTDKLLDIMGRYQALIREDYIEPQFKTSEEVQGERDERKSFDSLKASWR